MLYLGLVLQLEINIKGVEEEINADCTDRSCNSGKTYNDPISPMNMQQLDQPKLMKLNLIWYSFLQPLPCPTNQKKKEKKIDKWKENMGNKPCAHQFHLYLSLHP